MSNIEMKTEPFSGICQCCSSVNNLKSMSQSFINENKIEIYSEMLTACFAIKVTNEADLENSECYICDLCILRLRDSYLFRNQIIDVQTKLKNLMYEDTATGTLEKILKEENYSSEDEYLCFLETKSEPSDHSEFIPEFKNNENDENMKTKKQKNLKRNKNSSNLPISLENNSSLPLKNLKSNTKRNVQHVRKKLSKEEIKERIRNYQRQKYAKSIPYELDKTDVTCRVCNETFTTNKNLVAHMPEHYPNLICHICGKSVLTKKHLLEHLRSHNTDKVPCHICNKLLKKTSMIRHVQKHTGDNKIYACHCCPEKFSSYNTRLYHLAVVHEINTKRYKCKVCPKVFRFSGGLSTHVRRCHLQERNCPCSECGKFFFTKRELENHMLKHTKEKKFQCTVCLKSYGRKCTLDEHMKIHNNIKQYKCTICERAFTQKCTLNSHLKTHVNTNTHS